MCLHPAHTRASPSMHVRGRVHRHIKLRRRRRRLVQATPVGRRIAKSLMEYPSPAYCRISSDKSPVNS